MEFPVRHVFFLFSALLVVAVVAQFYFAAAGVFSSAESGRFAAHELLGRIVLPALGLITLALAALARAGRSTIWWASVPVLGIVAEFLLFLVNVLLSGGPTDTTPVSAAGSVLLGLHAVIGLVILLAAALVAKRACTLVGHGQGRRALPDAGSSSEPHSKVVA
jgi:hypothetical protein